MPEQSYIESLIGPMEDLSGLRLGANKKVRHASLSKEAKKVERRVGKSRVEALVQMSHAYKEMIPREQNAQNFAEVLLKTLESQEVQALFKSDEAKKLLDAFSKDLKNYAKEHRILLERMKGLDAAEFAQGVKDNFSQSIEGMNDAEKAEIEQKAQTQITFV